LSGLWRGYDESPGDPTGEKRRKPFIMKIIFLVAILALLTINIVCAGQADVLKVEVGHAGASTYRFDVTVRHNDEGWDHYANKWDVVAPDGTVLATRILLHPHENEQPFTRSLSGVKIPKNVNNVSIQAHDAVHGYGGKIITIQLPR
jgi:hypothetical protein